MACLALGLLLSAAITNGGLPARVVVTFDPRLCLDPCTTALIATIRPGRDNAAIELLAEGEDFSTDDVQPVGILGGQFRLPLRGLRAGDYEGYAILFQRASGEPLHAVARERARLMVR